MNDEYARTSETDPIRVDFLPDREVRLPGKLGMTFAPGMWAPTFGGRWERDLTTDLQELENTYQIHTLVSLMEDHEYRYYQIPELLEKDRIGRIEILRFAIADMSAPQESESKEFEELIRTVIVRLESGKNVVIHCRGGLGRTGTIAACVLVALGDHTASEAISTVRAARVGTVQTTGQEDFVHRFEETVIG